MAFSIPPSKKFSREIPVPIPYKGINAISPLSEMDPQEAILAYNLIPTQSGMQVRPGWQQWCTNLAGAGGVRTLIPVRGNATAADKLFACTINGIYDCTSSSSSPTLVVTFPSQTGNAGWGQWEHCTNLAGDVYLLYCDEVNGYYTFDTNTTTWLKVTAGTASNQINGVDPATLVSVRLYNNRIWFVQVNTGNAWYLPVGQIYGTVTQFSFGNKFNHGGNLNSLWMFTYGSVFGTYMYLVGIGDSGDVIAYTGSDPNSATTWSMAGQWYVGDLPVGRRVATSYGGDLIILSVYGAVNLSSLFYQKDIMDPSIYLTKKIAPIIKNEIANNDMRGWEIVPWPSQNSFLILDPDSVNTIQFCYNLVTNAWTVLKAIPMQTACSWHGNLYAGSQSGVVELIGANQDAIPISGSTGNSINWGMLGAFSSMQMPGVAKFVDLIRAYLLSQQTASYVTFARYDFDITDLTLGSGTGAPGAATSGWDVGIWDSMLWGAGSQSTQVGVSGSTGSGRWVAFGILGTSIGMETLVGIDASIRPTAGFL